MANFLKPRLDNFGTASIVFRLFLMLVTVLVIYVKEHSMTGWYYIPIEFYLMVGVPFLGFIAFTIYLNIGQNATALKTILRIFSILVIIASIAVQGIMIYSCVDEIDTVPLNYMIALIPGIFLFCSVYTLAGIFLKKL